MPFDPQTISQTITSAVGASTLVKGIISALKESGKSEAISQVIELQVMVSELIDKNRTLTEEILSLNEKLNLKAAMKYDGKFYKQDGDARPFCALCWESESKAIHLAGPVKSYLGKNRYGAPHFYCSHCKQNFYPEN